MNRIQGLDWRRMHKLKHFITLTVFLAPAFGSPLFLVVPNAQTSTPGNMLDSLAGGTGGREQEVFGRGQFGGVGGPLLIDQFAFRAAPGTGPASLAAASLMVHLSTSSFAPNISGSNSLITGTFANNLGPDNTLVYSGPLAISSPGCTASACPFDMVLTFTTPFRYNPAEGFLLLDLQVTDFTGSGDLDAERYEFAPFGAIASVFSDNTTMGRVETDGDIVQFGYTLATPEPATSALMLAGLSALVAMRLRSKRG